jgi:ABC-2 type transport system ATP-binding protein
MAQIRRKTKTPWHNSRGATGMNVINISHLSKNYGKHRALKDISCSIEQGSIVGLVGTNGAGKTTLLKAILGLSRYEGSIEVMGLNPQNNRTKLMNNMCFIADVAVLPTWLKVSQALDFVRGVHPRFDYNKALSFIEKTNIGLERKVGELSKGMIVQLHLALVMAIDVAILVLDEPTLGLDILYRKHFYQSLINDYYNEKRTIIITTHQVEEVEGMLTNVIMLHDGYKILDCKTSELSEQYYCIRTNKTNADILRAMNPITEKKSLGNYSFMFDHAIDNPEQYGEISIPGISDIFVAKVERTLVCAS